MGGAAFDMDAKRFYTGKKESSPGGGGSGKPGSVCHLRRMLEFMIMLPVYLVGL